MLPICRRMMDAAARLAVTLALLTACFASAAADVLHVVVVGNPENRHQAEFYNALHERLTAVAGASQVDFTGTGQYQASVQLPGTTVVTVGSVAARDVLRAPLGGHLLHALIPASTYQSLYPHGAPPGTSGLFIDQPLSRSIGLIRIALPEVDSIAVLLGPESRTLLPALSRLARQNGLTLRSTAVDNPHDIDHALETTLQPGEALLTIPDPAVINSRTARNLILGAYLRQVPIVGYSEAFVKAGALMAVYSSPEDLGRQAAEIVGSAARTGRFPSQPSYPGYYHVAVNYQVARTFGLDIASEKALASRLKEWERP